MADEKYFSRFRKNIVGIDQRINLADRRMGNIVYADWIASGRLYSPVEKYISSTLGPWVANTHTESTLTGTIMTRLYHQAREKIKQHVNAGADDSLFIAGYGMTAVVNKLQRILGLRAAAAAARSGKKPLVLITHMEHHSNQISWEECNVDVQIIPRDEQGLPDFDVMESMLQKSVDRPLVIGSFTACSNVTGIITPYHKMAAIMHRYNGFCFVDFAASAPYVPIDMHPARQEEHLDAIFFSPHKFLGGPGSSGVLVLNNRLYHNRVPDNPGGGTVVWTTPFGSHKYFDEIEIREDGGTPGFLQTIKAALAIRLKEEMGSANIVEREEKLKELLLKQMSCSDSLYLLERTNMNRLGVFSFYAVGRHHNLIVRLLNDYFGIQTRGGCSCAGTYGHILFNIDQSKSSHITEMIDHGDLSEKPGWVRISLHPTMTDSEVEYIGDAVCTTLKKYNEWADDYQFISESGDFKPLNQKLNFLPDLDNCSFI